MQEPEGMEKEVKYSLKAIKSCSCPQFKPAEPFPFTELSPSEREAYWEWKQRRIKDYSSPGL